MYSNHLSQGIFLFLLSMIFTSTTKRLVILLFFFILIPFSSFKVEAKCRNGCHVALASFYMSDISNLTYVSKIFRKQISEILEYNPGLQNNSKRGFRIKIPFPCDCLNGDFLGHTFIYQTQVDDTYTKIASKNFANLTTSFWLQRVNMYSPTEIPDFVPINVTVNCSCGDGYVSKDYGLFETYPLRPDDNISTVVAESGIPAELLKKYNPRLNFGARAGLVFFPAKDQNGTYPPFKSSSSGFRDGVIAGISVVAVVVILLLAGLLYYGFYRSNKQASELSLRKALQEAGIVEHANGLGLNLEKTPSGSGPLFGLGSPGISMDKSVEFTYEELAEATEGFNLANKIGQGGYGSVFYGVVRGERAAIKKMDLQASNEFLAELQVLPHVHHMNLVRLIGYCVEDSLFLVYEFIENGNLSQHLRGKIPLPWPVRVQIALDSARGLEYIHDHTVPVYIHRDIKSANILIDKDFRAKVADFGLTKLTDFDSGSMHTRLVGTFGYMPPEYAQYGVVSPKIDVYAFGVVLYELISAKEAIIKTNEKVKESKGLVALFGDILNQTDPKHRLIKIIDSRLADDYPLDIVYKVAELARACTLDNPQLRPSMRNIVAALMTLSPSADNWDVGSVYENHGTVDIMPGR